MRRVTVLILCVLILGRECASAQAPVSLGQIVDAAKLVVDLWPKLQQMMSKTPNEQAKPAVIALYKDLLDIRTVRNSLINDLKERSKELRKSSDCPWTCDQMQADADQLGKLLFKMRRDFQGLAIALHQDVPDMNKLVEDYNSPNGRIAGALMASNIGALNKQQVDEYYRTMSANTNNFEKLMKEYSKWVKSHYPDSLELLAGSWG